MTDKGNPTALIQNQLQVLRTERERAISSIYSLQQEKKSIMLVLPKILYELNQIQSVLDDSTKEILTLDNAIEEIEKNYGDYLYSPNIFSNDS